MLKFFQNGTPSAVPEGDDPPESTAPNRRPGAGAATPGHRAAPGLEGHAPARGPRRTGARSRRPPSSVARPAARPATRLQPLVGSGLLGGRLLGRLLLHGRPPRLLGGQTSSSGSGHVRHAAPAGRVDTRRQLPGRCGSAPGHATQQPAADQVVERPCSGSIPSPPAAGSVGRSPRRLLDLPSTRRELGRHGSPPNAAVSQLRAALDLGSDHHRIRAHAGDLPRLVELLRDRHRVRHRQLKARQAACWSTW